MFVRTDFICVYEQRIISRVDFQVSIYYEKCGSAAALFPGLRVRIPPGIWLSLVNVVCCQVGISALGLQRSPTECGVSEYDHEASIMRRPWPTRGSCAMEK